MESKRLKRLQNVLLDIMIMLDKFCHENNLSYTLFGGTAIGAVRHNGFIPWDDDLDIAMERSEFEKFIMLWKSKHPVGYYLQDPHSTDSHINHIKIRKDGTVLASKEEFNNQIHNGIWVDIFAIDKAPKNFISNKIYLAIAILNILYTRRYPYKKGSWFLELATSIMLLIPEQLQLAIRKLTQRIIESTAQRKSSFQWRFLAAPYTIKIKMPDDMFSNYHYIKFCNKNFQIVSCYKEMLWMQFGNFMELPPESQRICKHNPEIIIFNTSEEKYD